MKRIDIAEVVKRVVTLSIFFVLSLLMPVIVAFAASDSGSEETAEETPPPGNMTVLAEDGRIEFPFELYRGDIRFKCEVNGHPVHMLLDDGYMWDQLLFWGGPEVDSLDLVYDGNTEIGNDRSDKLASRTASHITVAFPGAELSEQTAIVTPSSSGVSSMWAGSVGQISAGLFKHFVVDINFDRMVITLIPPEKFTYSGRGNAVRWEPMGFGPRSIPATLRAADGRRVSMKLMMDLGYNDQILLVADGEHQVPLPERKLPTSLGFNMQRQETRGFVGRLPGVEIGGYELKDLVVSYVPQDQSSGTSAEAMVGLGLLTHFNLVFDYHNQRLFVEPNKSFDRPFEYNMTGFVAACSVPGSLVVREVYADSPADKAGLKKGDKLLEINGRPVADYDFFELLDLYEQKGARLKLGIERDGEKKDVSLKLERVI